LIDDGVTPKKQIDHGINDFEEDNEVTFMNNNSSIKKRSSLKFDIS
jgi:hypothetical protein